MNVAKIKVEYDSGIILESDNTFDSWLINSPNQELHLDDVLSHQHSASVVDIIREYVESETLSLLLLEGATGVLTCAQMYTYLSHEISLDGDTLILFLFPAGTPEEAGGSRIIPDDVFDGITDAILLCDPDFKIRQANFSAHSVYGGYADLIGQKCYEVLQDRQSPCPQCPLPATLFSGKINKYQYYNEQIKEHLETRTFPQTDEKNRYRGFTLVNRIVTSQFEDQLDFAQTRKFSALQQFVRGINTMLTTRIADLRGHLDILTKRVRKAKNQSLLNETGEIVSNINEIMERLVRYARVEEDIAEKEYPKIFIQEVINEVVDIITPRINRQMRERGIFIDLKTELSDRVELSIDPDDLKTALLNVVVNAIEALNEGGLLTIRSTTDADQCILTVSDTGKGMAVDEMEKIFDPFYSTKDESTAGLGLTEVYGILLQYDGTINVTSTPGMGTTIKFILPLSSSEQA